MNPTFEVYCGSSGLFYWRLKAVNGRVVADGSQGYSRRADAHRALECVFLLIFDGDVKDLL